MLYTVYLGEGTWAQYNFIYFHKKSADKSSTWYLMLVHPIHYASSFNNFELQRLLAFMYKNWIFRIMYIARITKIDILFKSYYIWIRTNIHLCYRYVLVYIDSSYQTKSWTRGYITKLGQANMDMFNTSSSQKCKVCYQKCTTYLLVLSCRNWKFIFSYDTGECEKRLQK